MRHFVRVGVLYVFIFFKDFHWFSCIAFGDPSKTTFCSFWPLPRPSKSAHDLQKWCSRLGKTTILEKSCFFVSTKNEISTKTLQNDSNNPLKNRIKTIIGGAHGRTLIWKAPLDLNMPPQDLHVGPPRLENPSQIHEFQNHFTSNTYSFQPNDFSKWCLKLTCRMHNLKSHLKIRITIHNQFPFSGFARAIIIEDK